MTQRCPITGCIGRRTRHAMMCSNHWNAVTPATKTVVYLALHAYERDQDDATLAAFHTAREQAMAEAGADQRLNGVTPPEVSVTAPIGRVPRRVGRPRKILFGTAPLGPAALPQVVDIAALEVKVPSRNITVGGRRTSVRLSAHMWDAVRLVATQCGTTIEILATAVDARRGKVPLTRAIETYVLAFLMAGRNA